VVKQLVVEFAQPVDFEVETEHLLGELGVLLDELEQVAHGHQDRDCADDLYQHRCNWRGLVLYALVYFSRFNEANLLNR
jgi:hypothetical protein